MKLSVVLIGSLFILGSAQAQQTPSPAAASPKALSVRPSPEAVQDYRLGPDDQIKIWALGFEEITDKPIRVDPGGFIDVPMLGRIRAGGLTVDELKSSLLERMAKEVRRPQASVEIVEFGSEPVSILGAVNQPGVQQLRGRKSLAEVVSMAGGLRQDAGSTIRITRQIEYGPIPLRNATADPSGKFSTVEVKISDLLGAKSPGDNIQIRAHDVVTVPIGETISVMGAVKKPGNFPLNNREGVSVLTALSLAEGLGSTPRPQKSKILRTPPGSTERQEIPIDLNAVLAGKAEDVYLRPNDILLVPTSEPKKAGLRATEAVIQAATGIAIWGRR
jgi:polysaccharide export outer membrane protein